MGVLDRTMSILDAVQSGARSFTQIVEATGLTRSTAHRLVKAMEDHGLLISSGGRGYRLGPRLLGLAATATRDLPCATWRGPPSAALAAATGESAQLYVREGDRRVCIEAVESDERVADHRRGGRLAPAHEGLRRHGLPRVGRRRRRRRARRRTGREGGRTASGEREPGVASVSAPVLDRHGSVAAVVSVSGPVERFGADRGTRFAPAVLAAAREVGAALGAVGGLKAPAVSSAAMANPTTTTFAERTLALRHKVDAWLTPRRAVVASATSFAVVALIAATPSSPYHPVLPDDYSDGPLGPVLATAVPRPHPARHPDRARGSSRWWSAGVAFLLILYACEQGMIPVRTVIIMTVSYCLVILVLPLLLSRDVFSYTYYGRILSEYRGNPFVETPANYPANDLAKFVWFGWRDTPSVYGVRLRVDGRRDHGGGPFADADHLRVPRGRGRRHPGLGVVRPKHVQISSARKDRVRRWRSSG